MRIYAEPQQEVITEQKLTSKINLMKERKLGILYICLGLGIVLLVVGLVSLLI